MTILTFLQISFYVIALPYIIGKITNNVFKIENNDEPTDVWYTGVWSSFFLFVVSMILWSVFKVVLG